MSYLLLSLNPLQPHLNMKYPFKGYKISHIMIFEFNHIRFDPDTLYTNTIFSLWLVEYRNAKRCYHATIGHGNMFRLRIDKG